MKRLRWTYWGDDMTALYGFVGLLWLLAVPMVGFVIIVLAAGQVSAEVLRLSLLIENQRQR